MCGLVSVVNKWSNGMSKTQQEVFTTLLFIDYLRGTDSTGVFAIHDDGDVLLAKEASDPIIFMNTDQYDQIMRKTWSRGNALVGHNRKATRGDITDENAHPFVVDDKIVLVHNGTMYGDHKKMADVEVDSHAIAHIIHEKKDVTAALKSFNAAYALIWYDVEKKTLNYIRNSQRPLYFMETHDSWIWASEKCMLDFVIGKHNLTVKTQPTMLVEDLHQMFYLENNSWGSKSEKLQLQRSNITYYEKGQSGGGRHHPYANAYSPWESDLDDAEDVVVREVEGAVVRNPPKDPERQRQTAVILLPSNRQGTESSSSMVQTTTEFERNMAHSMNKVVTRRDWDTAIMEDYKMGIKRMVMTFDYCFANQRDESGGYYVYAHVVDDPDVIVRMWFDNRVITEERIVQIASSEYVYTVMLANKWWHPFDGRVSANEPEQAGYCIIVGNNQMLVEGGGISNPAYKAQ